MIIINRFVYAGPMKQLDLTYPVINKLFVEKHRDIYCQFMYFGIKTGNGWYIFYVKILSRITILFSESNCSAPMKISVIPFG